MIEQGLVMLVQAGIGDLATGGFPVKLPENYINESNRRAWVFHMLTAYPTYTINSQDPFTSATVQIDCHGYTMLDAMTLARAIDGVLRGGFVGRLPDPDQTFVHGIFREPPFIDGFSDASRTYVRMLEYLVNYNQI